MVAPAVEGINLFKIAGRSISGWIPSFKTGAVGHVRQPFCSKLEERLLLWLEYHPQVVSYARGGIGPQFASTYRLPTPKNTPFAIGYTFEGKPHDYLPDVVGTLRSGKCFIAEAGMEDDKRSDRNLAKAEAARRLARIQGGVFWVGTERTLTRSRHYNLVFLHARRQSFPAFADIAPAVQEIWPWGEVASVEEIVGRFGQKFPTLLLEAAIWKIVGDSARPAKATKCTFSGVVPIELQVFQSSGIRLVECPDCARTRSLYPRNGVLRFPSHEKRKTHTPNTEQRWIMGKTNWDVVSG